jgi:predicted PolB exonuclease-like 3'-5' exonuclease
MSRIVFNIETIADPELPIQMLPEIPAVEQIAPHKGIKDPEKQKEFIAGKLRELMSEREQDIAGFGLHALTSKIICLSYKTDDREIVTVCGDDEALIVNSFNDISTGAYQLVGYNSKNFDLHHLAIATVRHSIVPHISYANRMRRYATDLHIDLYEVLSNFGNEKRGKLSDWCIRLGIEPPFGVGSMVTEWHQKSDWESIKHHCSDNVRCTYELLQKVGDLI